MSPDGLIVALTREVILRRPEVLLFLIPKIQAHPLLRAWQEFKIAALRNIASLFPAHLATSPFYAGFGNRITDVISYRAGEFSNLMARL